MEIVSNVWMAARSGALYISFSIEEMEISNQEDIKEQEKLDRQLLDLGPTVPLPEPEVLQPLPSLSAGGVLSRENSAEEGAR